MAWPEPSAYPPQLAFDAEAELDWCVCVVLPPDALPVVVIVPLAAAVVVNDSLHDPLAPPLLLHQFDCELLQPLAMPPEVDDCLAVLPWLPVSLQELA